MTRERASEITNKMAAEHVLFDYLLQEFFLATASCTPFFFRNSGISVVKLLNSLSLLCDRIFVGGFMHNIELGRFPGKCCHRSIEVGVQPRRPSQLKSAKVR